MSELVPHEHLVSVEDVLQRWHMEPWRLDAIIRSVAMPLFFIAESRVNPSSGATVHFCSGPFTSIHSHDGYYEYEELFIPLEDISAYEKAHPEVLWEPAVSEQTLKRESQELTEEYGEYIPADVIRKKMRMSPIQFIDFMNSGKGPVTSKEESFRDHVHNRYEGPFFHTGQLSDGYFSFHILDWEAWRREHPDMMQETPAREDTPIAGADDSRLSAALREKDARIAELEAALAAANRQQQSTVNAQKWRDSVQAACELLVSIMQGEKYDWRSGEFSSELRNRCKDYHTEVRQIAWSSLPDDFKHGPGRPTAKPENPEHTETLNEVPF